MIIRNRDGDMIADIPLRDNRNASEISPDIHPRYRDGEGELYAVQIGPPPQHGNFLVEIWDHEGEILDSMEFRFNCYTDDGNLP